MTYESDREGLVKGVVEAAEEVEELILLLVESEEDSYSALVAVLPSTNIEFFYILAKLLIPPLEGWQSPEDDPDWADWKRRLVSWVEGLQKQLSEGFTPPAPPENWVSDVRDRWVYFYLGQFGKGEKFKYQASRRGSFADPVVLPTGRGKALKAYLDSCVATTGEISYQEGQVAAHGRTIKRLEEQLDMANKTKGKAAEAAKLARNQLEIQASAAGFPMPSLK